MFYSKMKLVGGDTAAAAAATSIPGSGLMLYILWTIGIEAD
jgi:hypothetical protein